VGRMVAFVTSDNYFDTLVFCNNYLFAVEDCYRLELDIENIDYSSKFNYLHGLDNSFVDEDKNSIVVAD
jgi:hypothetical protein